MSIGSTPTKLLKSKYTPLKLITGRDDVRSHLFNTYLSLFHFLLWPSKFF